MTYFPLSLFPSSPCPLVSLSPCLPILLSLRAVLTAAADLFFSEHAVAIGVDAVESFRIALPLAAGDLPVVVSVHLIKASGLTARSGAELFARERAVAVLVNPVEDFRFALPLVAGDLSVVVDVHGLHSLFPIRAAAPARAGLALRVLREDRNRGQMG